MNQDPLTKLALQSDAHGLILAAYEMIEHSGTRLKGDKPYKGATKMLRIVERWLDDMEKKVPDLDVFLRHGLDDDNGNTSHYYALCQLSYMLRDYGESCQSEQLVRRVISIARECQNAVSLGAKNPAMAAAEEGKSQALCLKHVLKAEERPKFGDRLRQSTLTQ